MTPASFFSLAGGAAGVAAESSDTGDSASDGGVPSGCFSADSLVVGASVAGAGAGVAGGVTLSAVGLDDASAAKAAASAARAFCSFSALSLLWVLVTFCF